MDSWEHFFKLMELYPGSSLTKTEAGWEIKLGEFKYVGIDLDAGTVVQEALTHLMCIKLNELEFPKDFDRLVNGN